MPAIADSEFSRHSYGNMSSESTPISTFEAKAILVCDDSLSEQDSYELAKAMDYIRFFVLPELTSEELAQEMTHIDTHKGARKYYEEKGYLTRPPTSAFWFWFSKIGSVVAALVPILGVLLGMLRYKFIGGVRHRVINEITGQGDLTSLSELQKALKAYVRSPWYGTEHLKIAEWVLLDKLVRSKMKEIEGK